MGFHYVYDPVDAVQYTKQNSFEELRSIERRFRNRSHICSGYSNDSGLAVSGGQRVGGMSTGIEIATPSG